jgi:hypothetical protein
MALLLGGVHTLISRHKGFRQPVLPTQETTVVIPGSTAHALAVIRRSLNCISAREKTCSGADHPVLIARVPMSGASWGEVMRFSCHPGSDGTTEVRIHSRPLFGPTVVDWGKNLQNVTRVLAAIRRGLEESSDKPLCKDGPAGEAPLTS